MMAIVPFGLSRQQRSGAAGNNRVRYLRLFLVLVMVVAGGGASFAADVIAGEVRPFFARYCVSCHEGAEAKGEVDLAAMVDEKGLEKSADVGVAALVQLRGYTMPPPKKEQPSEAERAKVIGALAGALDRVDGKRPPFAGPALLRRLNRAEYRNAIFDLMGVDLELTADFPADDSAHGFDNVAEGLSLSPLLLEKYLAAAEEALGRLKVGEGTALERHVAGGLLEGVKPEVKRDGAVEMALEQEVGLTVQTERAEEYRVSVRASRAGLEAEPATIVLKLDGVDLKAWSVYATAARPAEFTATLRLPAGSHKVSLRHTWYTAQVEKGVKLPDVRLRLEFLEIAGPLGLLAHRRVFGAEEGAGASERDAAKKVLEGFASRAYRRPVLADELGRLMALYDRLRKAGRGHEAAVNAGLASVLVSPHFLFHVAQDATQRDVHGAYRLNDWEIASRLAFFLWSSPPDDLLRAEAAAGRLRDEEALRGQVKRMLADPRSGALAENFAMQWLGLRKLDSITFDRAAVGSFTPVLSRAMREEARMFFAAVVEEDRPIAEFLRADWTFVNEDLAKIYGMKDVRGGPLRRVMLGDANRGGVMTMPGVLAVTSYPTRTSAVKRGKWVLEELLGAPPPAPPPNVPALEAASGEKAPVTLREKLERHRADPQCFGCHVQMDALGLGLENFDAIGRWRVKDAGRPIDPSGTLPGGRIFSGPAELRKLLSERHEEFARCLTEKMLVYALGRGLQRGDRREVERIVKKLEVDGRFSTLVSEIVVSYPFRYRQDALAGGIEQRK